MRFMAASRIDNPKLSFLCNETLILLAGKNKAMVKYPKEIDNYLKIAFENTTRCFGMIHNLHLSLNEFPILICNAFRSSDLFAIKPNNSFMDTLDSNPTMLRQFVEGANCGFQIVISLSRLCGPKSDRLYNVKSYILSMSARRYFEFVGH